MTSARLDSSPIGEIASGDFKRDMLLETGLREVADAYKAHREVCYLQLAWLALKSNLRLAGRLAAFEGRARALSWLQWLKGEKPEKTTPLLPWVGGVPWKRPSKSPLACGIQHPPLAWHPVEPWRPRLPWSASRDPSKAWIDGYTAAMANHAMMAPPAAAAPLITTAQA